jgi:hypothetical protein
MAFHLEGPWLTTTGKKRGKKKWASAEAKQQAEELEAKWKDLLKRQGVEKEERSKHRALNSPPLVYNPGPPPGRETVRIASLESTWAPCVQTPNPVYTGTKVRGIGTMHKSNAVPIFSDEEAKEISSMRR